MCGDQAVLTTWPVASFVLQAHSMCKSPHLGVAQQPTAPKALGKQALNRILRRAHLGGSKRDAAMLELLIAVQRPGVVASNPLLGVCRPAPV